MLVHIRELAVTILAGSAQDFRAGFSDLVRFDFGGFHTKILFSYDHQTAASATAPVGALYARISQNSSMNVK